MNQLRIGILSTAGIARRNWRAIHESGNAIITAVASRDKARAREFVRECQDELPFDIFPAAFGSYEELLASPDVDAIYNPLPTGLRKEWVLRAAAAGKHVICEKPCGLSLADVRTMTDACAQNKVQFMDGVMFMHHPRMEKIRAALDDANAIGQIKRLTSMHTFSTAEKFFANNIRVHSALEPTGCLGDLGWYSIRFALWAMQWQMPTSVTAKIISARGNALSPAAAPTDFSAELIFAGGASASFYCSFVVEKQQWFQVSGSKGYLRLDDFVHPKKVYEPSFELNGNEVKLEKIPFAQDANLFRNFAAQILSGQLNTDWPRWALQTQEVMDACYAAALTATAS
ncbi:MAG: Glucose--fructose oxidoreductase precursor [Verrucomicrobiota bacterium]